MFSVGWRTGYLATRLIQRTLFDRMGNCNDKSVAPVVAADTESSVVCQEDELNDGDVREVQLADKLTCLIAKQKGQIFAVGNKCTHSGANLVNGSLGDGVITCPWHGACFNLATGDIEDFPGLDSLPKYDVTVEDGNVKVHFSKSSDGAKRLKTMAKRSTKVSDVVVVVGGGAAAQSCVEALRYRANPFKGKIIMICKESARPYDRIKLSKAMASTAEELALRPAAFYKEYDIDVMTSTEVVGVDTESKEVRLQSGKTLKFTHLVIATGGQPRMLNIPGSDAANIFVLRSPADANAILKNSEGKKVVIIGSSFIGMEVAASLAGKAASVTVVGNREVPFAALGNEIGKFYQSMHEEKGVQFIPSSKPDSFSVDDAGHLTHVEVNGEQLEADVCVLGIGVEASTGFLGDSGIALDERGNVIVNEFMETNVKDVFAAGDIAAFPLKLPTNPDSDSLATIGHWQLALAHGKCVGENIASEEFGKGLRYAGYGPDYDDIVYDGEVADGKFVAYFCREEVVVAVATVMRDPVASHFANRLRAGRTLAKGDALTEWFNEKLD